LNRYLIIFTLLLSCAISAHGQKNAATATFTKAEWQILYTAYRNSTFINYYLVDSFSRLGDSIKASEALLRVSPYHLLSTREVTPADIEAALQTKAVTSEARKKFVTQFTKAYNAPKSALYTQFKTMHDEDQLIRQQKASCIINNNCKALRRAMHFSDSLRAATFYKHVKKYGWPTLEDGSLYACVLAIHDHEHHNYYDSILYKAVVDGKVPLEPLLLVESWKRTSMDIDKLTKLLREKESVKIQIADLGDFKGLNDSTKSQIKEALKRLCPVQYYFTVETDSADKSDDWFDKHLHSFPLQSEDIMLITMRHIIANTCYTDGKHSDQDKRRDYLGLWEALNANKSDNEGVYVYLVSDKPRDTSVIVNKITDTFTVYFNIDESMLDVRQQIALQSIMADSLLVTDTLKIVGLADNTGEDKNNKKLSEQRAKNIRDYLVGNGIPQSHVIEYRGLGAVIRPTKGMDVAEDRRVDIIINRRKRSD
jgi:outer membrane protein OmpA-like peptidoglycan-associated protein